MLARISPGSMGFEHRRFECPKCDSVQNKVVASDPMKSAYVGWFAGELRDDEISSPSFWKTKASRWCRGSAFGLGPAFRISYAAKTSDLEDAYKRIQRYLR
jgi:hypothetical protein